MKISIADLQTKLIDAAEKLVSRDEAEYFAQENIETHIRKSPRTNPLKAAINDLMACADHKGNIRAMKLICPDTWLSISSSRGLWSI